MAIAMVGFLALNGRGQEPDGPAGASPSSTLEATMTPANSPAAGTMTASEFKKLSEIKWDKILPDLGENSPEISVLHVDPTTHATQLLIRTSKAIHIRKHWHTANETHMIIAGYRKIRMRRQESRTWSRFLQLHAGENGARSVAAGELAHIHQRGWRVGCELGGRSADLGRSVATHLDLGRT